MLVLEDCFANDARRGKRIKDMTHKMVALGKEFGIETVLLSRSKVRMAHFSDGEGTKDAQARIVAERFPEETGDFLPPPRRAWDRENHHMGMFEAVALALAFRRMGGTVPISEFERDSK